MDANTLVREWGIITQLLPSDWREQARTTGAFRRGRQIRDPSTLLLLILLHVGAGLSLRQAAARAQRLGLATVSDVALLKRLRSSGQWLHALAAGLFASSPFCCPAHAPAGRRVRIVDATHVSEPGSTGTDWRIHYVLQTPSLECDFFEVTNAAGGESYTRVPVHVGDIILGDRGYCHREGVAHVVEAQGDAVVRLNAGAFPLLNRDGSTFDPLPALRTLQGHEPQEWPVAFTASGKQYSARLCAVRKSEAATERARRSIGRVAAKKQKQVRPETLEMAEYIAVLTTLTGETATAEVLDLYRTRWQIELAFKRIKSLFGAGHVPKYDAVSARAWLHGKLLAVLLIERLSERARLFSPWGFELTAP